MKTFTNHTAGPRGINIEGGSTVWLEPGETREIDSDTIVGKVPDLGKPGDVTDDSDEVERLKARVVELETEVLTLTGKLAAVDGDGNGGPGGSKPANPPALTGRDKAELLAIAKAEGVEASEALTIAQIIEAIKAKRAA